ncbi:hypothetical protein [Mesorhizobium caraganae]|uniref:non-homologous end-joining DNA ligase LigD n=1 Tax=Mesorhizobium caraganae TaxID=483206 RepID=UPI003338F250
MQGGVTRSCALAIRANEGTLRHPSYLGLREDKKPEAVLLETERHASDLAASATTAIATSNRDRVIYPESNITKGQLADHYAAVAAIMLPWVGGRPIGLVRCPQGRAKKCSSKNTMPAALATKSTTSASRRRTGTRNHISMSTMPTD